MDEKEITITLKVPQWNVVMQGLGNMPFAQVNELVNEIKVQADAQLSAPTPSAE